MCNPTSESCLRCYGKGGAREFGWHTQANFDQNKQKISLLLEKSLVLMPIRCRMDAK